LRVTTTSTRAVPPASPDVAVGTPDLSLWGSGTALRIDLPAPWPDHVHLVAEALSSMRQKSGDGTEGLPVRGPVAFGALPFDRELPASFVVPVRLVGRTARGDSWTTVVDGADLAATRTAADLPSDVQVRAVQDPEDWCDAVAAATKAIAEGDFTKVVLARELLVEAGTAFDPAAVLARFVQAHPHALTYLVNGFVGASPELLVSRLGETVRAQPMAGTTPRTGDPEVDQRAAAELLASAKNRAEHQITIDMVHDTLLTWCSYLDAEPTPSVVPAGPVQHLATMVEGRLSRPLPSVLEMVAALHPTPAVGGWPVAPALAAQARLEHLDRGRYAGPVGWVDAEGNGIFAVGIRGAELDGNQARVFAGVGVVADSDPAAELAETQAKFKAALSALVRP
jgi:menaquinone-specific isochorismate synthase